MSVITDIEKQALDLPEKERAKLADRLIASLPADFTYDEEIEEGERRSREIDKDQQGDDARTVRRFNTA